MKEVLKVSERTSGNGIHYFKNSAERRETFWIKQLRTLYI